VLCIEQVADGEGISLSRVLSLRLLTGCKFEPESLSTINAWDIKTTSTPKGCCEESEQVGLAFLRLREEVTNLSRVNRVTLPSNLEDQPLNTALTST